MAPSGISQSSAKTIKMLRTTNTFLKKVACILHFILIHVAVVDFVEAVGARKRNGDGSEFST